MAEWRSPKPQVVGSIPTWPASLYDFSEAEEPMAVKKTQHTAPTHYPLDRLKWLLWIVLLAAGLVVNDIIADQVAGAIRAAGGIVLAAILIALALTTAKGQRAWRFAKGARMELRKVVWPTRRETGQTTIIVMIMVIVTAIFLWGLDTLLIELISLLTGQRG